MNKFVELLRPGKGCSPVAVQTNAKRHFSKMATSSNLDERNPNDPILEGTYLIIGVASYSPAELQLLDKIDAEFKNWRNVVKGIGVFDVTKCGRMRDFEKLLPGLAENISQTPIVAIYVDGTLKNVKTGLFEAQEALKDFHVL